MRIEISIYKDSDGLYSGPNGHHDPRVHTPINMLTASLVRIARDRPESRADP